MAHIKTASASDWTALQSRPNLLEIKISRAGFLPSDSRKIAKEIGDRFVHEVRKIEGSLDPANHKYSHVISCGCTELFGCNRNADGWSKYALERDMPSYLKHAKCFRDHRNKKDDLFYGRPKVAFFDKERGYGRLLVEYFATDKAASEKNARIADGEIDALDKDAEFRVSHGTKIPHDTCSICGNEASTRAKYCSSQEEGGTCRLFGCKTGLSKISEEGEMQFVHNDAGNIFYDISSIGVDKHASARQADRIAYATPYDIVRDKVASFNDYVPGSSWMSEQMGLSQRFDLFVPDGLTPYQERMAKVAIELAEYDSEPSAVYDDFDGDVSALRRLVSPCDSVKRAAARDLATRNELIGPRVFAKLSGASSLVADQVAACVPGIYRRMAESDQISSFVKSSCFTNSAPDSSILSGLTAAPFASIDPLSVSYRRKVAAVVGSEPSACSCESVEAARIATEYAAFKVAVASQILAHSQNAIRFIA